MLPSVCWQPCQLAAQCLKFRFHFFVVALSIEPGELIHAFFDCLACFAGHPDLLPLCELPVHSLHPALSAACYRVCFRIKVPSLCNGRLPMKKCSRLLRFAFVLVCLAFTAQVHAGDYYIYQDAEGKLVISNQKPPSGSKILKQQTLADESVDNEQAQERRADIPPHRNTQRSAEAPKNK
jgi:hypothetical protein